MQVQPDIGDGYLKQLAAVVEGVLLNMSRSQRSWLGFWLLQHQCNVNVNDRIIKNSHSFID